MRHAIISAIMIILSSSSLVIASELLLVHCTLKGSQIKIDTSNGKFYFTVLASLFTFSSANRYRKSNEIEVIINLTLSIISIVQMRKNGQ